MQRAQASRERCSLRRDLRSSTPARGGESQRNLAGRSCTAGNPHTLGERQYSPTLAHGCHRRYRQAVAGYYLGLEPPSSLRTALALRRGIWRKGDPHREICGAADTLYTDNGANFTSKQIEQALWTSTFGSYSLHRVSHAAAGASNGFSAW